MNKSEQLASRFREVIFNGSLIANTNFQDQLTNISFETAIRKQGSLNTIAALCFHINYYVEGVLPVLEGGRLEIRDRFSFDMTAITSPEQWSDLVNRLFQNAEKFAILLRQMPETQLDSFFVNEKYGTYQRNIDGMIEHCYYHLGQIVLMRKMLAKN